MFRSEDMRLATVFSLSQDRDKVFSALQKAGILQLTEMKDEKVLESLKKKPPVDDLKNVSDLLLRVSRLVSICKLARVKLPFPQEMFGLDLLNKEKIVHNTTEVDLSHVETILNKYEKPILKLEEEYTAAQEELEEKTHLAKTVKILQKHGLEPQLLEDTKNTTIIAGSCVHLNEEKLIEDVEKETEGYGFAVVSEDTEGKKIIIAASLKEYSTKLGFTLKRHGIQQYGIPNLPKVKDLNRWLETKIKVAEKTIKESLAAIKKHRQKNFKELVIAREQVEIIKAKIEAMHKVFSGDKFFTLQGWVPKSKTIELTKVLFEATEGHSVVEYEKPKGDEESIPVKLTNPKWLKPFSDMTELYALPKYKDLDPTFIVGPILIVFAGFMLTDFFYGAGLFALGLSLWLYFSKFSPGIKNMGITITGIGVFSMFFGILTGSYFGDMFMYLIGKTSEELAFWKDPLANPMYFLIISLSVAVIHINIGLVLGAIEDVRKKDYKTLLKDRIVWWMVQLVVVLIYFGVSKTVWIVLAIITILTILVTSGPLGILGITGFMGDIISYSRLFALALSTAGIAMTFNLLANMMSGIPYVGFILAIVVFIVGHIFSFLMNALGSFVHGIRLQFVEFFGKFYDGGGDAYEPFKEERYYTEVEE